jgi:hypothetical protein
VGALLSPLCAAAKEPPHVRVEVIAGPDLIACDREDDFRIVLGLVLTPWLFNPPTTHVLRARFRKVPGGYGVDLALSGPGGSGVETRHREYVGVCCFEAMYLAAKESAHMIAGETPAGSTLSAPVCPTCPVCAEAAPGSAPASQSVVGAPLAATSSKKRDFPRVELDVEPDLLACLRPDALRSLLEELVVRGIRTDTVLHVRIRRSPRGGFAVDVRLEDDDGNTLGSAHFEHPDSCCFEVLYVAATHGAYLLREARTKQSKAELDACPPCRPCPPEVPSPPLPAPVAPARRPPARRVEVPRSTLTRHLIPGVLVGPGIASGWGPGVQLGGDVRSARWSFEFDASVMFPVSFEANEAKTSSAWSNAWTVSGSLAGCQWFDERLAGCLVGSAGVLRRTRPWAHTNVDMAGFATAGLRAVWEPPMLQWSKFRVRLEGEIAWAFGRPEPRDPRGVALAGGSPLVGHMGAMLVWPF